MAHVPLAPDCDKCSVHEVAADDPGGTFHRMAGETECGRVRRSLGVQVMQYTVAMLSTILHLLTCSAGDEELQAIINKDVFPAGFSKRDSAIGTINDAVDKRTCGNDAHQLLFSTMLKL
jgi:hypothetical protein